MNSVEVSVGEMVAPVEAKDVDLDVEIKKAQLAAALLDVKLKNAALENMPSFVKGVIVNPVAIGALIASAATLSGVIITSTVAEQQMKLEDRKASYASVLEKAKYTSALILEAIRTDDADRAAANLQFLMVTGLLQDNSGAIHKYLENRRPGEGLRLPGTGKAPPK